MNKAIICPPEEMNRLQYVEENKMTFEDRLNLAFSMLELSKALAPKNAQEFIDDEGIEWITLRMINDQGL